MTKEELSSCDVFTLRSLLAHQVAKILDVHDGHGCSEEEKSKFGQTEVWSELKALRGKCLRISEGVKGYECEKFFLLELLQDIQVHVKEIIRDAYDVLDMEYLRAIIGVCYEGQKGV